MDTDKITTLLTSLREAVTASDNVDTETLQLLTALEIKFNAEALQNDQPLQDDDILTTLQSLEAKFAVKHPLAENTLREIIDILGKMGI